MASWVATTYEIVIAVPGIGVPRGSDLVFCKAVLFPRNGTKLQKTRSDPHEDRCARMPRHGDPRRPTVSACTRRRRPRRDDHFRDRCSSHRRRNRRHPWRTDRRRWSGGDDRHPAGRAHHRRTRAIPDSGTDRNARAPVEIARVRHGTVRGQRRDDHSRHGRRSRGAPALAARRQRGTSRRPADAHRRTLPRSGAQHRADAQGSAGGAGRAVRSHPHSDRITGRRGSGRTKARGDGAGFSENPHRPGSRDVSRDQSCSRRTRSEGRRPSASPDA